MNSLSWLIYVSDLVGSLKPAFGITSTIAMLAWCGWWLIHLISADDYTPVRRPTNHLIVYGVIGTLIAVLTPGPSTMRLIAASEFGERIVNSERVQGIVDPGLKYVEQWLKDQLKKEK